MATMMKMLLIPVTVVLILYSCKGHRVNSYENNIGVEPAHLAQADKVNYTVIEFPDSVKNFGTIKSNTPVVLKYKFRNAGETVLFITNVNASCGCTVADYPKKAILPGEEGFITATFNPKNHPGFIHKTITITSNTSNGIKHILVLTGQVKDSL